MVYKLQYIISKDAKTQVAWKQVATQRMPSIAQCIPVYPSLFPNKSFMIAPIIIVYMMLGIIFLCNFLCYLLSNRCTLSLIR